MNSELVLGIEAWIEATLQYTELAGDLKASHHRYWTPALSCGLSCGGVLSCLLCPVSSGRPGSDLLMDLLFTASRLDSRAVENTTSRVKQSTTVRVSADSTIINPVTIGNATP